MKTGFRLFFPFCFLLALALCSGSLASATEFYVDPVFGNNSNNGTSPGTAFKSMERARNAVRLINGSMTEDITVHLRGGIHRLTSTLTLGSGDSGTNGFNVVYQNYGSEVPVISGGVNLLPQLPAEIRESILFSMKRTLSFGNSSAIEITSSSEQSFLTA